MQDNCHQHVKYLHIVAKCSVLGPLIFMIYINDLADKVYQWVEYMQTLQLFKSGHIPCKQIDDVLSEMDMLPWKSLVSLNAETNISNFENARI